MKLFRHRFPLLPMCPSLYIRPSSSTRISMTYPNCSLIEIDSCRRSGNWELGTGNWELGTGNWELGTVPLNEGDRSDHPWPLGLPSRHKTAIRWDAYGVSS